MATDPLAQAALALHRFGLGPRMGGIVALASDLRGMLWAELDQPGAGQLPAASAQTFGLKTSSQSFRAVAEFTAERAARAKVEASRQRNAMMAENPAPGAGLEERTPAVPQRILQSEYNARAAAAMSARTGFVERLVWFWSNHFCISAARILSMAGAYEREAIRPHVLGRFGDMLLAAESHPAMLIYLDNAASIGPNSVAGVNRTRGIDENLAREILELHTLGVDGGYSQDDVLRFAYALTGWTIVPATGDPDRGGEFVFVPRMHEPGPQIIMGKSYAGPGVGQARAVLADLAAHPATAKHIALKFARHFVADDPPQALVERLERNFLATGGDLKALARTLIESPEAWVEQRAKLKRPSEWVAGMMRLTGARPPAPRVLRSLRQLGEPLWSPLSPKGFAGESAVWIDGVGERLNLANAYAQGRAAERLDARELVDAALGPLASQQTRESIARAESRQEALTILLMSPEFMRR